VIVVVWIFLVGSVRRPDLDGLDNPGFQPPFEFCLQLGLVDDIGDDVE